MTVKELIEELQEYDPDTVVVLSRDPEGNGYSPSQSLAAGLYSDGEYYANLKEYGFKHEEPQACVSIWPRN